MKAKKKMSKKITVVLTVCPEDAANITEHPNAVFNFASADHAMVAYNKTLSKLSQMAPDEECWLMTTNEAVALALRTAVAKNLVRAKDARVVFINSRHECRNVLFEDVLIQGEDCRNVDFANYPDEFMDLWPHSVGDLADAKPDEGWEPRPVFNECGDDYLPEINAVLGEQPNA